MVGRGSGLIHSARVTIQIGGIFASREPTIVSTVLGSCIAACLRDPVSGIGGMNHFMLPVAPDIECEEDAPRYGVHAMELLIGEIQKLGGQRARLEAKVFGGGHVLNIADSADGVPQRNIRFIHEFLRTEGIPILAHDLGGRAARQVHFDIGSGKVRLRRLAGSGYVSAHTEKQHEAQAVRTIAKCGDITLFDD